MLEQKTSVVGGWGTWTQQFRQQYTYDRYGNRTIDGAQTWGTGVNNKQFTVDTATNRLGVPVGQTGVMSYDNAGNLTNDTYTGAGSRTYDAENRMMTAADNMSQTSRYTYDVDGHRVRRQVGSSQEEWQIYGIDGELIVEYPANAPASAPEKEYGYRNGELLITAQGGLVGQWKLDENTGTTTADSSGSGNAGTLTSGATWGTGQSGSAVSLDGVDDYVQVGAPSSLVMTSAVSLSAWIYPTGAGSNGTYGGTILVKEGEYIVARFPNGKIEWGFANSNPGWVFIDTGYTAALNQWTHIAVTYDNGTIKTYANGALVHTYSGAGTIGDTIPAQNDFRIGGRQVISQNFQGRIDEVLVYNRALTASEVSSLVSGPTTINWLVTDHLGTPRMILDQTGSFASLKRHDYLPFGEELFAGTGGRTVTQGYSAGDGVRQQFTQKERDNETGLDYFLARYYSNTQGRFTSPDEFKGGPRELFILGSGDEEKQALPYAEIATPQSLNKYTYAYNNPLRYIDPDGHDVLGYELIISGPNQVPNTPHPEVPNLKELGPQDTGTGGYFALNLKVNFDAGDNIQDYKHVRTAIVLNNGDVRSGSKENPEKSQTTVTGQSRIVFDEPGIGISGAPKASLAGQTVVMALTAGEYNTKTKQLSSNMAYYAVKLVFDKKGNLDRTQTVAVKLTRDQFIKLTEKNLPKDKKTKQACPECTLSPPN